MALKVVKKIKWTVETNRSIRLYPVFIEIPWLNSISPRRMVTYYSRSRKKRATDGRTRGCAQQLRLWGEGLETGWLRQLLWGFQGERGRDEPTAVTQGSKTKAAALTISILLSSHPLIPLVTGKSPAVHRRQGYSRSGWPIRIQSLGQIQLNVQGHSWNWPVHFDREMFARRRIKTSSTLFKSLTPLFFLPTVHFDI